MENLFDLTGKVAVITGSPKELVEQLLSKWRFTAPMCDFQQKGRRLPGSCRCGQSGSRWPWGSAIPIACHIGYKDQMENLVAHTREKLGKIDILVCNAAVNPFYGSMLDIPDSALKDP